MTSGVYIRTKKTRKILSKARRGFIPWNKGLTKEIDARVKKSAETLRNAIKINKKVIFSIKRRKNMSLAQIGRHPSTEFKIGNKINLGKHHSKKTIKKISKSLKGRKNIVHSNFMKRLWSDSNYVRKQIKSRFKRPTKPELELINIIKQNRLPYKYVGDGEFILGGKCPDFLNVNGQKKVIEVFGDYWHKNDNPRDRINFFKKYGFDCLIIWEHELRNKDLIFQKIKDKFL